MPRPENAPHPLTPAKETEIRDSFDRQAMMKTIGARIDAIAPGRVTLSLPVCAQIGQQHGYVHAGASFALGDSAAGYAALSLMPLGAEVLTVEMKINLIAPAAGRRLIATGEVVKAGRRLLVTRANLQAEAADGSLREVALLLGTMIPA
ncbi:Phenylacetic acid degradation protein PaaD, thioesterase [Roseibacterium elongatum DSM 19469]|uniref:Medium/long-chain acyl-CoA thioesterase YigI n=1 Tax=Roseicyclus elongatus DSM 19469 TaxID=1294273 RepID=W8S5X4_9RHOB|nr:PaaI family thioesterase [Roseibacterium elongatum]AHM04241.1 Phenylacetic acid degradation protein PaaD, thioesterase [Roseibacterium elongatum DSM 19469]